MDESENNISLRRFNLSDLDDIMVWMSDNQVSQFCGWDATDDKEECRKDLEYYSNHQYCRAICLKDRPIGYVCVNQGQYNEKCRGEIGYVLASKYWGQGIATLAVKMMVSSVFADLTDLERIEAQIDVENVRSQRVVEKAGFLREGVLRKNWILKGRTRDMVMYSFLRAKTQESQSFFPYNSLPLSTISQSEENIILSDIIFSDVSLRPFNLSDFDMIWRSDDQVSQFCGCNTTEEAKWDLSYIFDHHWYKAICLEGQPIGYVFVNQGHDNERCRGEITYFVASKFWGRGIATLAVKMMVSSVFADFPDLERVEAQIDVENVRSQRVVEKVGFFREGVLRKYLFLKGQISDIVMYSALRSDVVDGV